MRKIAIFCCLFILASSLARPAFAQDAPKPPEPTPHYYHLDFVVLEIGEDGKPVNSRSYSTTVTTDNRGQFGSIRTGTKVPVITSGEKQEVNYVDVGINIDVQNAREVGHELAINLTADVSDLAKPTGPGITGAPLIHQNRWQAVALLTLGKPTIAFSSDNLENKGKIQLTVTATPLQ